MATIIKIYEISGDTGTFTGTYIAGIQSVAQALIDHSNDNTRKVFAAILFEDERQIGAIAYAKNGEVRVVGE